MIHYLRVPRQSETRSLSSGVIKSCKCELFMTKRSNFKKRILRALYRKNNLSIVMGQQTFHVPAISRAQEWTVKWWGNLSKLTKEREKAYIRSSKSLGLPNIFCPPPFFAPGSYDHAYLYMLQLMLYSQALFNCIIINIRSKRKCEVHQTYSPFSY